MFRIFNVIGFVQFTYFVDIQSANGTNKYIAIFNRQCGSCVLSVMVITCVKSAWDRICYSALLLSDLDDSVAMGTLSATNMEALLETEDELAYWDADRLMLEIDDALTDAVSSGDRTVSVSPRDQPVLSDTPAGDLPDGIHRVKHGKDGSGSTSAKRLCRSNSLPSNLETDEFGMPLAIFTKVY